jgi:hypothetical protein
VIPPPPLSSPGKMGEKKKKEKELSMYPLILSTVECVYATSDAVSHDYNLWCKFFVGVKGLVNI